MPQLSHQEELEKTPAETKQDQQILSGTQITTTRTSTWLAEFDLSLMEAFLQEPDNANPGYIYMEDLQSDGGLNINFDQSHES